MCDTFFCPNCRRHKPISLRSNRRMATTFSCQPCVDRFNEKNKGKVFIKPNGELARLSGEQVRTSRIRHLNKQITAKQAVRQLNWLISTVT